MKHQYKLIAAGCVFAMGLSTFAIGQDTKPQAATSDRAANAGGNDARTAVRNADGSMSFFGRWNELEMQLEVGRRNKTRTAGEPEAWDPIWQIDPRFGRGQRPDAPN